MLSFTIEYCDGLWFLIIKGQPPTAEKPLSQSITQDRKILQPLTDQGWKFIPPQKMGLMRGDHVIAISPPNLPDIIFTPLSDYPLYKELIEQEETVLEAEVNDPTLIETIRDSLPKG